MSHQQPSEAGGPTPSLTHSTTTVPNSTHTATHIASEGVVHENQSSTASHTHTAADTKQGSGGVSECASGKDTDEDARFVCNICLDPVQDAVVTVCGHLYCWPCLFRWLNIGHTTCPVCKAGVTKENVIPLYLQGCQEDPRVKHSAAESSVPNRPSAQRPTPQPNIHAQQGGMQFTGPGGGGMAFSAGLGFFPSLFGLQFQNFAPPPPATRAAPHTLTPEEIQQNFVSQALLMLGIFVLFCLLLV